MFEVAHLADGGITILKDQPDLAGRKFDMGILSFLGHQLAGGSCASNNLPPFSHLQLDIVNQCAGRDISKGQGVAGFDIRCRTGNHLLAHLELRRGEDVSLLPVGIVKQGNPSRSIRIVFDGGDFRRDLPFVSFEINHSIFSFVTSSPMPCGDSSIAVSSSRPF